MGTGTSKTRSQSPFPTRSDEGRAEGRAALGRRPEAGVGGRPLALAGISDVHRAAPGRDPYHGLAPDAPASARTLPGPRGEAGRAGRVHASSLPLGTDRPDAVRGGARRDRCPNPPRSLMRPSGNWPAVWPRRSPACATGWPTSWPTWRRTLTSPRSRTSTRSGPRRWRPRSTPPRARSAGSPTGSGGRERPEGRPRVVLIGPPNAGKSRLFNALLGVDRAIVSPVAGTTRDYLEAACDCDGLAVELVDTAGAEEVRSLIESRGANGPRGPVGPGRPRARLPDCRRPGRRVVRPPEARRLDQGRRFALTVPVRPGRHQRLDRRGTRRPPAGDRRCLAFPGRRVRPPRRHRRPMRREPRPRRAIARKPPPRPFAIKEETNSWPSTSARRSTTSAGSWAPSSPTTCSTGSSGGSASASEPG